MKKIEAIIQPSKLEAVKNALAEIDLDSVTITRVRGFGRQRGKSEIFPGSEYSTEFSHKVKIEVVLDDSDVDAARALIVNQAKTGRIGDGKIFIVPIEETIRIRTSRIGTRPIPADVLESMFAGSLDGDRD